MACVALFAALSGVAFARLAMIQDLNPFLWGVLAVLVYLGLPGSYLWRGFTIDELPWVWISSLIGLVVLFIVQSVIAAVVRYRSR